MILKLCIFSAERASDQKVDPAETKIYSPLLHVLRLKRFDFNMFGCAECRTMIECTNDLDCQNSHGRSWRCEEQCCSRSIKCVLRVRDDDFKESDRGENCGSGGKCDDVEVDVDKEPSESEGPPSSTSDKSAGDDVEPGQVAAGSRREEHGASESTDENSDAEKPDDDLDEASLVG